MKIWNFVAAGALGLVLATLALTPSNADESRSKLPSRHPPLSLNSAAIASSGSDAFIGHGNAGVKSLKSRPYVGAGVMAERRSALLDDIRQTYVRRQTRNEFVDHDDERRASMRVITTHKAEKGTEVRVSKSTGAATFLRKGALPIVSASIPVPASEQEALIGFLTQHKALFQIQSPDRQLALARHRIDPYGKRHYLYQQSVNGVPVHGAQVLAHFNSQGGLYALTARTRQIPASFETTPSFTGSEVEEIVRGKLVTAGSISVEPVLQIRVEDPRHPRLVYAVTSIVDNVNRWKTIIDAKTGRVLKHYKDHCEANAASSGLDLHGITRNFNTWYDGSVYYMVDVATPVFTGSEDPLNVTSPYGDTL